MVAIESRLPCAAVPLVASSGRRFGCSGIFAISALASSQASRFYTLVNMQLLRSMSLPATYLLAPIPVAPRKTHGHLPQIRHLLPLEAVQVRLDCRA